MKNGAIGPVWRCPHRRRRRAVARLVRSSRWAAFGRSRTGQGRKLLRRNAAGSPLTNEYLLWFYQIQPVTSKNPETEGVEFTLWHTIREEVACASRGLAGGLVGLVLWLSGAPAFAQLGHIHELYYDNAGWTDTDLTSLTGAPSVSGFSGMSAFITTPNDQFHVYYQDENFHIHQFYFNGQSWSDADLTAVTNGATARSGGSGMAGFTIGNYQYVYFVASDLHVHEYS